MRTQLKYVSSVLALSILAACNTPTAATPSVSTGSLTGTSPATAGTVSTVTQTSFTHYVYAANKSDDVIAEYGVSMTDGSLVPLVGNETVPSYSQPSVLGMSPNLKFIYALCANGTAIDGYVINSNGSLTRMAQGGGSGTINPQQMAFSADSSTLYVLENQSPSQVISAYQIDPTSGALQFFNTYAYPKTGVNFLPAVGGATFNTQYNYSIAGGRIELYVRRNNAWFDSGNSYGFNGALLTSIAAF